MSKAGISLNRMSEDVDIKLVPVADFSRKYSRSQRKNIRKDIIQIITEAIMTSEVFSFDEKHPKVTSDEYRYNEIPVRYPQVYAQAPCLRPVIKLEIMETDLLEVSETRDIYSLIADLTKKGEVVEAFPCATIISTQAEKLVSMMRRTAASVRNLERGVDESLVRHVYDNFCIVSKIGTDIPVLKRFVQECIKQDIERYGNQYLQFCESPIEELKMGLEELVNNPVYKERYQQFVVPMVFGERRVSWEEAYACFRQTALDSLVA